MVNDVPREASAPLNAITCEFHLPLQPEVGPNDRFADQDNFLETERRKSVIRKGLSQAQK